METQKKDDVVVNKRKKWMIWVIISIVAVLAIVAVVVIVLTISSSGKDRKLQEQLDLGEKYISEMDYEQAIVAYEAVIEIDPMSVEAYLGLASVYEAQEDYEKALEVLQLGYEKTQSDNILQEINRIKELISQDGNEQVIETEIEIEGDGQYPIAVQGRVVEGIYHNPYYEYPLIAEDKDYLVQLIDQAEQGNYEAALDLMDNDRLIAIVETFADGESYINAMVDDKKVHIFTNEFDNDIQFYQSVEVIVLPIETGNGYYFLNDINRDNNGVSDGWLFDQDIKSYGYGYCKEGVFWGDYTWKKTIVTTNGLDNQEISTNTEIYEGNIMMNNGLYDGEYTHTSWSDYDNMTRTIAKSYDMGLVKYWDLQEGYDAEFEYCTFVWGYSNGEEVKITNSSSVEETKEWLDTERCSIVEASNYKDYCQIDEGWRYYYW